MVKGFIASKILVWDTVGSIIDLSTGDQPMFNDDISIALIFNGEIYNYIELRDELKTLGHKFHTNSDTEVIIRSYEQWGIDCQNKFNGRLGIAGSKSRKSLSLMVVAFSSLTWTPSMGSTYTLFIAWNATASARISTPN